MMIVSSAIALALAGLVLAAGIDDICEVKVDFAKESRADGGIVANGDAPRLSFRLCAGDPDAGVLPTDLSAVLAAVNREVICDFGVEVEAVSTCSNVLSLAAKDATGRQRVVLLNRTDQARRVMLRLDPAARYVVSRIDEFHSRLLHTGESVLDGDTITIPWKGLVLLDRIVKAPVKVIFDTDTNGDFDDVGALAMLHKYADAGLTEILGTFSCLPCGKSISVVETLNHYYGRADLPTASPKPGKPCEPNPFKGHGLFPKYDGWYRHADAKDAPDALEGYRRILAAQPDKSVVICGVGSFVNFEMLLKTELELVAKKVKKLVVMACKHPEGKECNSAACPAATKYVLENWPTPVEFSDFDYGWHVYSGRTVAESDPEGMNPVRDVFANSLMPRRECFQWSWDRAEGHPSWDETAVMLAVEGSESGIWSLGRGRYEMVGEDGTNRWTDDPKGPHLRIKEGRFTRREVGEAIDRMIALPPDAAAHRPPAELVSRAGLGNFFAKCRAGGTVKVAYFGGSITEAGGWRVQSLAWLRKRFPQTTFVEVNAALGGTGSDYGAYRIEKDVLGARPDLMFVEYVVNDGSADHDRAIEGYVRSFYAACPKSDICFVYTTGSAQAPYYEAGICPPSAATFERIADYYGIPSVCMALRAAELAREGRLVWKAPRGEVLALAGTECDFKSPEAGTDKIIFSADGAHAYRDTGHVLYTEAIIRSFEKMIAADAKPVDHAVLPKPFRPDFVKAVKFYSVEDAKAAGLRVSGAWRKDMKMHSPGWKDDPPFYRFVPTVWRGSGEDGEISFSFRGSSVLFAPIWGPGTGEVEITVDGETRRETFFDEYCAFWRLAPFMLCEGLDPEKVHTVIIRNLPGKVDKRKRFTTEAKQKVYEQYKAEFTAPDELIFGGLYIEGVLKPQSAWLQ